MKHKTISDAAQDAAQQDSVYDFLYHDARRIASFLGQLDPSGHITTIKQTAAISKQEGEDGNVQTSLNLLKLAGINSGYTIKAASTAGESSERNYDPIWANALSFLDYLSERNLIVREISNARIGQFLLITGKMMLTDIGMLKTAWEIPGLKKLIQQGAEESINNSQTEQNTNRQQRRSQEKTLRDNKKNQEEQFDLMIKLIQIMPHSLQARMFTDKNLYWCSLSDDSAVGRASDIILKYGSMLSGEWSVLGVLDALPYDPDHRLEGTNQPLNEFLAELTGAPVAQLSAMLGPIAQQLLGRPSNYYGLTPLLIFREIAGYHTEEKFD